MTAGLLLGDALLLPRSKAAPRRNTARTQASQLRVRAAKAAGQQQGAGAKQPAAAGKELLRSSKAGNSAQSNAARPAGRTTTVLGLPATLPPPLQRVDTRAAAAALGGVALLALLLARPWLSRGSVNGLVERGVGLAGDRNEDDSFYKGVMSGMRTAPAPELSDEAIQAARARRRVTVSGGEDVPRAGQELGAAAVPTNHPWATSKNRLTPEQEEAKRQEVLRLNRTPTRRSGGQGDQ